jgi:hypothetical protein
MTETRQNVLEQPTLTAEEAAELRQSSQEAIAEFRARSELKRKAALQKEISEFEGPER